VYEVGFGLYSDGSLRVPVIGDKPLEPRLFQFDLQSLARPLAAIRPNTSPSTLVDCPRIERRCPCASDESFRKEFAKRTRIYALTTEGLIPVKLSTIRSDKTSALNVHFPRTVRP
jgi:hypothetical protein